MPATNIAGMARSYAIGEFNDAEIKHPAASSGVLAPLFKLSATADLRPKGDWKLNPERFNHAVKYQ